MRADPEGTPPASRRGPAIMVTIGSLILLAVSFGAGLALFWYATRPVYWFGYDLRGPNCDPRLRRTAGQPYRHRWEWGPFVVYRDR